MYTSRNSFTNKATFGDFIILSTLFAVTHTYSHRHACTHTTIAHIQCITCKHSTIRRQILTVNVAVYASKPSLPKYNTCITVIVPKIYNFTLSNIIIVIQNPISRHNTHTPAKHTPHTHATLSQLCDMATRVTMAT